MIKVIKKAADCPKSFKIISGTELKNNLEAVKLNKLTDLSFNAYKNKQLGPVLDKIFKNKCAYCESYMAHLAPWDIEHYRPKSKTFPKGVKKTGFIGYYWLAAEWDNLLISCIHCNRPKRHNVPGKIDKILIGKHEQFPLDKETLRCKKPSKVGLAKENKVRLLIHPCLDDPEKYFVYEDGNSDPGNIRPNPGLTGYRLRKAEKSIEVYALHRIELVKRRAAHADQLKQKINVLNREIDTYNNTTGRRKAEAVKYIQEYMALLVDYASPEREYAALSRQIIWPIIQKLRPVIRNIK